MDVLAGEETPANTDVSPRETFLVARSEGRRLDSQATSKVNCRLRFKSSSQLFFISSSEKLILYFRLVVALYIYIPNVEFQNPFVSKFLP